MFPQLEWFKAEKNGYSVAIYADEHAEDPRIMFDYWDESEVTAWEQGEVFGYVVEDQYGEHIDSCWGFYGYDWAESQATEALEYFASLEPQLFESDSA